MAVVRVVGAGYAYPMPDRTVRILDLFAGAGGLTAGFHEASSRFRSVAAVKLDPAAAASYSATFPGTDVFTGPIQEWLAWADMPADVDVVVGGPPCQGFSVLGKRDAEDERNLLWRQYAEVLTRVRPGYFVVDNVPAFSGSRQYRDFLSATRPGGFLEDYALEHRILNAADYGAPQIRKRIVVLGHRRDLKAPGFPEATHGPKGAEGLLPYMTVSDALLGVPAAPDMDGRFDEVRTKVGDRELPGAFSPRELHFSRRYRPISRKRFAAIPGGGSRANLPDELKAPCWLKHTTGSMDVMGRLYADRPSAGRLPHRDGRLGRLHADRPSVTIRTEFFKPERGRYLHPTEDRAITHYEAACSRGRVSAKSAAGGLMSGVVGVLARVRRGPAGTMGGA